jgi:hypothetical protein
MDKEAAYTKIAGSGLDFGKSSPLTISVKWWCNLKRQNSLNSYFDADEAKINCIPLLWKSTIKFSTFNNLNQL